MSQRFAPYVLLAPFLLVFGIFMVYPLAQSIVLTTQQTYGPEHAAFVGLDNVRFVLRDPRFWTAVQNTALFTIGGLVLQLPLAFVLALALNHPRVRGRAIFRLVFFAPSLIGFVFAALLAAQVFEKQTGLVTVTAHELLGSSLDMPWFEEHIIWMMVLTALWMYAGFNMVYFLAALQNVDRELLEAAQVDGAGPLQRFWHVTVAAVRPVAGFVVLLSVIGSLQLFELPYILFEGPGPKDRGLTVVMYLYQTGFEQGDLGYASAIGWLLTIALAICALFQRLVGGDGSGR